METGIIPQDFKFQFSPSVKERLDQLSFSFSLNEALIADSAQPSLISM